ncbi:MAG: hypothetical protein ACEQSL_08985 [Sediminibacterium sp.]
MPHPAIEDWFTGARDYVQGSALYSRFGKDEYLKYFFNRWATNFNRKKLECELRRISDAVPDRIKFNANISLKEYLSLPELVQRMNEEKNSLYKEMSHLHSRLSVEKPQEERRVEAFRILAIDKRLRELWKKLDHYAAHGALPEPPGVKVETLNPLEAFKRKRNLASYLSRTPDSPKADTWRAEIEVCDKIINGRTV